MTPAQYHEQFVINVALTGAVADAAKNPALPITTDAIVEQATACRAAGAAIGHFHVRDENGRPSTDASRFAAIFERLRGQPATADMVLCATTSGRHGQTIEQRTAVLDLPQDVRPDMASLTLGSLDFVTGASINDHNTVRRICERMQAAGVKPEIEIFDLGMAAFMGKLIEEGLLVAPFYVNVLLGNLSSAQVEASHFGLLQSTLPAGTTVVVAGIGRYQLQANLLGVAVANGVRVGLEDNLWFDAKRTPATNPSLVQRIARIAELAQRRLTTPGELRSALGLRPR